jgi:hypothetical protein
MAVINDGPDNLPEFPVEAVLRDELLTEIGRIEKGGLLVAWFEHNLSAQSQMIVSNATLTIQQYQLIIKL